MTRINKAPHNVNRKKAELMEALLDHAKVITDAMTFVLFLSGVVAMAVVFHG